MVSLIPPRTIPIVKFVALVMGVAPYQKPKTLAFLCEVLNSQPLSKLAIFYPPLPIGIVIRRIHEPIVLILCF